MSDFQNTIDRLGDDAVIDSIINRTITEFKDDMITQVSNGAFYGCKALTEVELPNCTYLISFDNFRGCTSLNKVSLPLVRVISAQNFMDAGTSELKVYAPSATVFNMRAFEGAEAKLIDTANLDNISNMCFKGAKVKHLVLRKAGVCSVNGSESGIENIENVYVHKDYLDAYKNDTNWSAFEGNWWTVDDLPSPEEL